MRIRATGGELAALDDVRPRSEDGRGGQLLLLVVVVGGGGVSAVVGAGSHEQFAFPGGGGGRRHAGDVGHLRHLGVPPDYGAGSRVADRRPERSVARVPGRQERHERDHERATVLAAHRAVQHEVGSGVHHHQEVEYGVQAAVHVVRGRLLGRLVHGRGKHHHGRGRLTHAEHDHHGDQRHGHFVLLPLPVPHHVPLRTTTKTTTTIILI